MLGQTDTTLHPDWKIKYILYAKIQIRAKLAIYFKIIQYFLIFYFSRHLFFHPQRLLVAYPSHYTTATSNISTVQHTNDSKKVTIFANPQREDIGAI